MCGDCRRSTFVSAAGQTAETECLLMDLKAKMRLVCVAEVTFFNALFL